MGFSSLSDDYKQLKQSYEILLYSSMSFTLPKQSQYLDLSFKTDLDFLGLYWKEKKNITKEIQWNGTDSRLIEI